METKVEVLSDSKVKLTVTIDAKEVDQRIAKTYKDFAYKYNFPGFRKGKAPRPVIDNALGAGGVLATVTDDLVSETYPHAVDEGGIHPVAKPEIEEIKEAVENGKPFSYVAVVSVLPEYELSNYDPVEIELPGEAATEMEIVQQIDALREHYYEYEEAPADTALAEGGHADLAMEASDDKGERIEAACTTSRLYSLGSGFYPPEFDEQLVGLKKGDKKSFDLDTKDSLFVGLADVLDKTETIHFDIEVKAVKEKTLPEVTDEWAKESLGFEGVEDLRDRIRESIDQSKADTLPRLKENQCLIELVDRFEGEVPDAMVESTEADLLQNFFKQLQAQNTSLDAYLAQQNIDIDTFRGDIKNQAAEVTKQDLALDAWARHKKYEITDQDITEEFEQSGAEDPKALEKDWRENGQLHVLKQSMLRVRAMNDVMDTAIIGEPGSKQAKKAPEKKAPAKKTADKKEDKPAPTEEKDGKEADHPDKPEE